MYNENDFDFPEEPQAGKNVNFTDWCKKLYHLVLRSYPYAGDRFICIDRTSTGSRIRLNISSIGKISSAGSTSGDNKRGFFSVRVVKYEPGIKTQIEIYDSAALYYGVCGLAHIGKGFYKVPNFSAELAYSDICVFVQAYSENGVYGARIYCCNSISIEGRDAKDFFLCRIVNGVVYYDIQPTFVVITK